MANEFIQVLRPLDLIPLQGSERDAQLVTSGTARGRRLLKSDDDGFSAIVVPPAENTQGTGWTLSIGVVDDGADSDDLGKVVRLGVTVKLLATGADTLVVTTAGSAEATVDVTLDATSGEIVLAALAIANAALDSVGVGNTALVRIRRIGSHANDTCKGTAILTHVYIRNT